jgi:hypothetical protein
MLINNYKYIYKYIRHKEGNKMKNNTYCVSVHSALFTFTKQGRDAMEQGEQTRYHNSVGAIHALHISG